MTTARNVAIVLAIAALIAFLPGGGDVAELVSRTLSLAFIGVIVFGSRGPTAASGSTSSR